MKTKQQLEYRIKDLEQSLEVALDELNAWKKLQILGETPEQVYEFWRKNQIKMFKYQREAIVWKDRVKKIILDPSQSVVIGLAILRGQTSG
jgi:hypothetical protein